MENGIQNSDELEKAIAGLRDVRNQQERQLSNYLRSPGAMAFTAWSLYRWRIARKASRTIKAFISDPILAGSRLLLPAIVIRAFFRRSNFSNKGLVTLICRILAKRITLKRLGIVIRKAERLSKTPYH